MAHIQPHLEISGPATCRYTSDGTQNAAFRGFEASPLVLSMPGVEPNRRV